MRRFRKRARRWKMRRLRMRRLRLRMRRRWRKDQGCQRPDLILNQSPKGMVSGFFALLLFIDIDLLLGSRVAAPIGDKVL